MLFRKGKIAIKTCFSQNAFKGVFSFRVHKLSWCAYISIHSHSFRFSIFKPFFLILHTSQNTFLSGGQGIKEIENGVLLRLPVYFCDTTFFSGNTHNFQSVNKVNANKDNDKENRFLLAGPWQC